MSPELSDPPQRAKVSRPERLTIGLLVAALLSIQVIPAIANVILNNEMFAEYRSNIQGLAVYPYRSGSLHSVSTSAGFTTGTLGGDAQLSEEAVGIRAGSGGWWNDAWTQRQCFTISAATSLDQYPVEVILDTTGLTDDDIRVVAVTEPDATVATPLPHLTDGPLGTTETSVWFQAPISPTPTDYCVYYDNPTTATSTSDRRAPFTLTNGQTISYYAMVGAYDGSTAAKGQMSVVSYVDNNTVTHNGVTVVLNAGDIHTFTGVDRHATITATGPIDGSGSTSDRESLLPESMASNQLIFPSVRASQRFWVRSPFGATTVEAVRGGTVIATLSIGPGDGSLLLPAETTKEPIILRSTDGTDFLATHQAGTNYVDIFHGIPWRGQDLFGINSTRGLIGAAAATSVPWVRSDGQAGTAAASDGALITESGKSGGTNYAMRLTAPADGTPIAAIQQADGNGYESTSFRPLGLLSSEYRIPISYRYIAFACPVPGTILTINGIDEVCDGTGVGHYRTARTVTAAGTHVVANNPVYAYYESGTGSDERTVFGAKGAVPYVPNLSVVPQATSGCGTWTSAELPVSGVMGLADIDIDADSWTYQISFDGGPFVGPDGTEASSFRPEGYTAAISEQVIPYGFDEATTAVIRVSFCGGADAELRSVEFGYDLAEVAEPATATPSATVATGTDGRPGPVPLLRVYPHLDPGTSWVEYLSATSPDSYRLEVDTSGGLQIEAVGGAITDPSTRFDSTPYTVSATAITSQNSTVTVDLVDEATVQLRVGAVIEFTSP